MAAALWDSQSQSVVTVDSNQGVCSDTSSTEMQCLRQLHHSGVPLQERGQGLRQGRIVRRDTANKQLVHLRQTVHVGEK
jgi:hypothetical protein